MGGITVLLLTGTWLYKFPPLPGSCLFVGELLTEVLVQQTLRFNVEDDLKLGNMNEACWTEEAKLRS